MKKLIVVGIIGLFILSGIIPSTIGTLEKKISLQELKSPGYIQSLIDNASIGDTIYIPSGTYYENIIINKSISLVGEDKDTTIIDGNGSGTVVQISADWVNISGFTMRNNLSYPYGGIEIRSNYTTISGNIISKYWDSIRLYYSSSNNITYNNISNNRDGIHLYDESIYNTITGNNISNNRYGIYLSSSSNSNTITGNNISNNYWGGIHLSSSNSNNITCNNISNNWDGISLSSSSSNNVSGNTFFNDGLLVYDSYQNTVSDNVVNGKPLVYLEDESNKVIDDAGQVILIKCDNITIQNQELSNTTVGILLCETNNSLIHDNTISSNNRAGIHLHNGDRNTITGNSIIKNNDNGIYLWYSSNNTITSCNIFGNGNIESGGDGIALYSSNSNNITDNNISSNNCGGIFLYYSESNTIADNDISSNNRSGVWLSYTNSNTITGNNISNNEDGIRLYVSSNTIIGNNNNISLNNGAGINLRGDRNTITGNTISGNGNGIDLSYSSSNTITGNNISNNEDGIYLLYSGSNTIADNDISSNNNNGITLSFYEYSNSNIIYHNNFINNTQNAYDECNNNTWDNGYPSCGNYWDDYEGIDANGDGVGDIPYNISGDNNHDRYPLMESYGMTKLSLNFIRGGLFKFSGDIKNIGNNTAFNVQWKITIDGGFILLGRESSDTIPKPLLVGEETKVSSKLVLGFGLITITIEVWADNAPLVSKSTSGFLILFFII